MTAKTCVYKNIERVIYLNVLFMQDILEHSGSVECSNNLYTNFWEISFLKM